MNKVTQFFHLCSGASLSVIKRYPTERSKYAGIGATVFFTGIFAALASGYAFFTVFDSWVTASIIGVIWGLMIFNLDRFIVSSMRKTGDYRKDWLLALPRIILAILIAISISKPLELKIFEKEISNELVLMQQELRKEQENAVKTRYENIINLLESSNSSLKTEVEEKIKQRDILESEAIKEADGTGGTKQRNAGPIYKIKRQLADKSQIDLDSLQRLNKQLVSSNTKKIDSLNLLTTSEIARFQNLEYNGMAARMEAMSRITKKSSVVGLAGTFIFLLFIAVECSPIFVKLMSTKGPYDDRLRLHESKSHLLVTEQLGNEKSDLRKKSMKLEKEEQDWVKNEIDLSV